MRFIQEVPAIGPATAGKIVKMRKSYGPFKSVDDLCAIKGIGPKRLKKNAQIPGGRKTSTKNDSKTSEKNAAGIAEPSPQLPFGLVGWAEVEVLRASS